MKNSTLLIRSLLIIAITAGIPHALAFYSPSDPKPAVNTQSEELSVEPPTIEQDTIQTIWLSKYEVTFEGLQEKAVYQIKKEGNSLKCYSIELIDALGNRYPDSTLVMSQIELDEYTAKSNYKIEYEGNKYDVESYLVMNEAGDISLNYTYYEYSGKETWKRLY
ncbi:MAG: hypothetical protein HEP71_29175 [Roseivirga sp.]|nr:hypothetical protein [Roseivirga sp.]